MQALSLSPMTQYLEAGCHYMSLCLYTTTSEVSGINSLLGKIIYRLAYSPLI